MYYWAHSETPANMPCTPGRLSTAAWPPALPDVQPVQPLASRPGARYSEAGSYFALFFRRKVLLCENIMQVLHSVFLLYSCLPLQIFNIFRKFIYIWFLLFLFSLKSNKIQKLVILILLVNALEYPLKIIVICDVNLLIIYFHVCVLTK